KRDAVLGIVKRRYQDGPVRYVEVRITRGEAWAVEVARRRHGQIDHADLGPVFESYPLETLAVFLEWPVVRIVRVRLPAQYDRAGIDEATQIVHMAVGIVARDSLGEPQDVRHAEPVAQDRFDLAAPEAGVPARHGASEPPLLPRVGRGRTPPDTRRIPGLGVGALDAA